jgi:hypothetical protein
MSQKSHLGLDLLNNTNNNNSSNMQKSSGDKPLEAHLVQHHHMEAPCSVSNVTQNAANLSKHKIKSIARKLISLANAIKHQR